MVTVRKYQRHNARLFARALYQKVLDAMKDPALRKDFEEWHEKTYGTKFEWKERAEE